MKKEFIVVQRVLAEEMTFGQYLDIYINPSENTILLGDRNAVGYVTTTHSIPSWEPKDVFLRKHQYQPQVEKTEEENNFQMKVDSAELKEAYVTIDNLHESVRHLEVIKHITHSGQILRTAYITLDNGYTVVGRPSASANVENDRAAIGTEVAIKNAMSEVWPLLGFRLKDENLRKRKWSEEEHRVC